jgi:hypothetical protein
MDTPCVQRTVARGAESVTALLDTAGQAEWPRLDLLKPHVAQDAELLLLAGLNDHGRAQAAPEVRMERKERADSGRNDEGRGDAYLERP